MIGRKLHNLQYLRAVAAVSAVVFHADSTLPLAHSGTYFPFSAGVGLGVFFIISGFIMMYTSVSDFGQPAGWWRFARRRLARIVPLYWTLTLVTFAVKLAVRGDVTVVQLIKSLFFIPFRSSQGVVPVLTVGWTLNMEMLFYIIFTVCLLLPRKIGIWAVVALLASIAALSYAPFMATAPPELKFFTATELLEFVAGMGLGYLCLEDVELPFKLSAPWVATVAVLTAAIGFTASAFLQFPGKWNSAFYYSFAIIPVAIAVLGADLPPKNFLSRFLEKLGDVSYSLYLCHPFVCFVLRSVVVKAGLMAMPIWLYFVLAVSLSCVAAIIINMLIEKPFSKWADVALKNWSSGFERGRRPMSPVKVGE